MNKKVLTRWFCGRHFGKRNAYYEKVDCSNCRKHGTIDCPDSFFCYSTEDKLYFEPKAKMDVKDGEKNAM
jgi:hypothetical protein